MNHRAQICMLPDGQRLHLQDGPIDLIIQAFGAAEDVARALDPDLMRRSVGKRRDRERFAGEDCADRPS